MNGVIIVAKILAYNNGKITILYNNDDDRDFVFDCDFVGEWKDEYLGRLCKICLDINEIKNEKLEFVAEELFV